MIQGALHTGFVVRDLDKAVSFYRDVVGLEVQRVFERTGAAIGKVVGYENAHLRITTLGTGNDHILELIQYLSPPPEERPTEERSVVGASHLAFLVDDIDATHKTLVDGGARTLNPPAEGSPGRRACYLQDPDLNWIELLEISG